jgi:hypothetical protein
MDDFNEPMMMFPPDTLAVRMEQLRRMVEDMGQYPVDTPEWGLLNSSAELLLISCKMPEVTPKSNLHTVH